MFIVKIHLLLKKRLIFNLFFYLLHIISFINIVYKLYLIII